MHRQSIGSPSPRHVSISGELTSLTPEEIPAEELELKVSKPVRSSFKSAKSVHLIPVLTLLCFLILYLSSHDPSPADLVSFSGSSSFLIHSKVTNEMSGAVSQRGLKVDPKLRIRKLGIR